MERGKINGKRKNKWIHRIIDGRKERQLDG